MTKRQDTIKDYDEIIATRLEGATFRIGREAIPTIIILEIIASVVSETRSDIDRGVDSSTKAIAGDLSLEGKIFTRGILMDWQVDDIVESVFERLLIHPALPPGIKPYISRFSNEKPFNKRRWRLIQGLDKRKTFVANRRKYLQLCAGDEDRKILELYLCDPPPMGNFKNILRLQEATAYRIRALLEN